MKPINRRCSAFQAAACSALIFAGCTAPNYNAPISRFNDASAVVIESSRQYFNELNKVERDNYLYQQLGNRQPITLVEVQNVQVFQAEDIAARLDALAALQQYGNLLASIANSDAPVKVASGATDLANALVSLQTNVSNLTGSKNDDFKAAAGPVATILGEIASHAIQKKIEHELNEAITKGEQPIANLIAAIRSDIVIPFQRKRSFFSNERVRAVDAYARELNKGNSASEELLDDAVSKLRTQLDKYAELTTASPSDGLDAMAAAHSAMVKYAKSPKEAADLGEFLEAMQIFSDRAKRVGEAIKTLVQLK